MMSRGKKAVIWCLLVLAMVTALMATLLLITPTVIQSQKFKAKLVALIDERFGGQLQYDDLRLKLLPTPRLEIHKAAFLLPNRVSATTDILSMSIRLRPLLFGNMHLDQFVLNTPEVTLFTSKMRPADPWATGPSSDDDALFAAAADITEALANLVERLQRMAGEAVVRIQNGRLHLAVDGQIADTWQAVDLTYTATPATMGLVITASATAFGQLKADLLIEPTSLDMDGLIQLRGVDLPGLFDRFRSASPMSSAIQFTQGALDLKIHLTSQQLAELQARLEISATDTDLHIRRNDQTAVIEGLRLEAEMALTKRTQQIKLTSLRLNQPPLTVSGSLFRQADAGDDSDLSRSTPGTQWTGQLAAQSIDIAPLRTLALKIASDLPTVRILFDILRRGRLNALTARSSAGSLGDLDALEKIMATVDLVDGGVRIPRTELDVSSLSGKIRLDAGELSAVVDHADLIGTRLGDGRFTMDLLADALPMDAEIAVQTDLGQLTTVLAKVLDDRTRATIDAQFADLQGQASGRFEIGGPVADLSWRAVLDTMKASLGHPALPVPLQIASATARFADRSLFIDSLAARLGDSTVESLSGQVDVGERPVVRKASAQLNLSLADLHAWAKETEAFEATPLPITAVEGRLKVSELSYQGPLMNPSWKDLALAAKLENARLLSDRLPAPLEIATGDLALSAEQVRFQEVAANLDATRLSITGAVKDLFSANRGLALAASGEIDAGVAQWAVAQGEVETWIEIQKPVGVPELTVFSNLKDVVRINGRLEATDGPVITADLHLAPEKVLVNGLTLKDAHSDVIFSFEKRGRRVQSAFSGQLDMRSLDTLLAPRVARSGWARGELSVDMPDPSWMNARLSGQLKGSDLSIPIPNRDPLLLETFALATDANRLDIEAARVRWGQTGLDVSGWLAQTEEGLRFDLSAEAAYIDVEALLATLNPPAGEPPPSDSAAQSIDGEPRSSDRRPRAEGSLNLSIDHLEYGQHDLLPLEARVEVEGDQMRVMLTEARLCDLDVPGSLQLANDQLLLDLNPSAVTLNVGQMLACLTQRPIEMDGRLYLLGNLTAEGPPSEIVGALSGPVTVTASEGRIYKANTLAKILELVNVTEIFAGQYPGLGQEGLAYRQIDFNGHFDKGVFRLDVCKLDGPSLQLSCTGKIDIPANKLDITVLAAPLKTVDRIIGQLPIVRDILGGTLLSIPIKVKGPLDKPAVVPLSPEAIGESVVNLLKRTLQVPVKILKLGTGTGG